jgi:hypothetical protein
MITLRPFAVLAVACLGWASLGLAQDAPKDDALDNLLRKLEDKQKADSNTAGQPTTEGKPKTEGQPTTEGKPKTEGQPATEGKPKTEGQPKSSTPGRPSGSLAPKDQALDSLLEKLGETQDVPDTEGRPGQPGPGGLTPPTPGPPAPGQPDPNALNGKAKDLDEHLEELTGRIRKKNDQDQEGQGSGPLADVIKQMRDVEQRLGKPDTGEETRQKQEQIVRKLDQVIEQIRNSPGRQQGRMRTEVRQAGNRPGGQQGGPGAQGNNGQGVGPQRPANPNNKSTVANDKDAWGHLPEELRQAMENVFKEEPLPDRRDWISRYYISVNKKAQSREE